MTQQAPKAYDVLHFYEYLDGGSEKPFFNKHLLQGQRTLSSTCQTCEIEQTAVRFKEQNYPVGAEDEIVLQRYSQVSQQLLNLKAVGVAFPGGRQRSSFRLLLENGCSIVATRRFDSDRALFESLLLRRFDELQVSTTPRHYAFNGLVLFQEDLPGIRLSEALKRATVREYMVWMGQALESLLAIQRLATKHELQYAVPMIGTEPAWLTAFIDRTALLGHYVRIPCPLVPVKQLHDRLTLLEPRLVKWDARPGNAMLDEQGQVRWFDWEHCCARNPLDDMVWLLCDDPVPDFADAEEQLIERYLPAFAEGQHLDDAWAYLHVFGTHHACIRVCRLLDEKGYDSWAEFEARVNAQPDSLLAATRRLCRRAARWAAKDKSTMMLSDWFMAVSERIVEL